MLRRSLKHWIVTGSLGPLRVGATQAELSAAVGHPDQAGCPVDGVDTVWKYGDIELRFAATSRPYRVFCGEMHAFDGVRAGGRRIRLDAWIVRTGLPREQMLRALGSLGVAPRADVPAYDDSPLQVVVHVVPRLHLDFITSDRRGWPIGLHGVAPRRSERAHGPRSACGVQSACGAAGFER